VIALAELAAAIALALLAARRRLDYLLIAALALALGVPISRFTLGDISRYLPSAIWSEGGAGKDQFIDLSIASTLLLPLIAAAFIVFVVNAIRSAAGRRDKP
jgi:ABC-type branched-subunit amino acid transport system permease subunit